MHAGGEVHRRALLVPRFLADHIHAGMCVRSLIVHYNMVGVCIYIRIAGVDIQIVIICLRDIHLVGNRRTVKQILGLRPVVAGVRLRLNTDVLELPILAALARRKGFTAVLQRISCVDYDLAVCLLINAAARCRRINGYGEREGLAVCIRRSNLGDACTLRRYHNFAVLDSHGNRALIAALSGLDVLRIGVCSLAVSRSKRHIRVDIHIGHVLRQCCNLDILHRRTGSDVVRAFDRTEQREHLLFRCLGANYHAVNDDRRVKAGQFDGVPALIERYLEVQRLIHAHNVLRPDICRVIIGIIINISIITL